MDAAIVDRIIRAMEHAGCVYQTTTTDVRWISMPLADLRALLLRVLEKEGVMEKQDAS